MHKILEERGGKLFMRFTKRFLLAFVLTFGVFGCYVYMAATQPDKKDISVLKVGSPRSVLIAEFGAPVYTGQKDGKRLDIFKFTQGYHGVVKGGRAVLHGAADVLTLGLWEVVGTPIEGAADGTEVSIEVVYDKTDRVQALTPIQGKDALK